MADGTSTTKERDFVVTRQVGLRLWRHATTALAVVVCTAVVACGNKDEDKSTENPSTAVNAVFDASPAAGTPGRGGLPTDADTATVSIKDGKLDPEYIEGDVGMAFVLTINGDGQPHTIEIDGLVDSQN